VDRPCSRNSRNAQRTRRWICGCSKQLQLYLLLGGFRKCSGKRSGVSGQISQRPFEPSHYHTIRRTRYIFGREIFSLHPSVLEVKPLQVVMKSDLKCPKPWIVGSLADSCVSSGLVFWEITERLKYWGDHPHTRSKTGVNAVTAGVSPP